MNYRNVKEWLIKNDQVGDTMKSYIPTFDWNNGEEVYPFDWLFEDKVNTKNKSKTIRIKKD